MPMDWKIIVSRDKRVVKDLVLCLERLKDKFIKDGYSKLHLGRIDTILTTIETNRKSVDRWGDRLMDPIDYAELIAQWIESPPPDGLFFLHTLNLYALVNAAALWSHRSKMWYNRPWVYWWYELWGLNYYLVSYNFRDSQMECDYHYRNNFVVTLPKNKSICWYSFRNGVWYAPVLVSVVALILSALSCMIF